MTDSHLRIDNDYGKQPVMGIRNLHNFVYCPRLFYLQWVENIFQENADTVSGSYVHRNVDQPSKFSDIDKFELSDGTTIKSLKLESKSLGLVGVIDIIEKDANLTEIVEYKRGSSRHLSEGEYAVKEPDAMQIAAQALLMRENGLAVNRAFVYYAADKKRVPVDLTEDLFEKVRKLILDARELAASGKCPPPLKDDSRCLYCSAYPVCLPNESRYWANPDSKSENEIKPPMADSDDGEVLVVQNPKAYVGKHGEEIYVSCDGIAASKIPVHQLRSIYLYGPVQISAQLMQTCLEENIDVSYFSSSGRFLGLLRGLPVSGIDARRAQYMLFDNPEIKMKLSREIIRGKITNQRVLLMRNGEPNEIFIGKMKYLKDKANSAENENQLLGIEGEAAAIYFSQFSTMIKNISFDFKNRNRRPPRDPVNSLLSLGYSVLAKEITGVCYTVGLDPFLGFYHHPRYGRPALALDLMEEFRPLIVDSLVISLINRGELDLKSDFMFSSSGCNLNDGGRRTFWQGWVRRLDTEITHPVFGYKMSYRRMFEIQARQLWRFLRGEADTYTSFTTR